MKELNNTQSLQDTIDVVTVALGFLSCGTWNPNTLLSRYIKTLKMEKKLSPNVSNMISSQLTAIDIISLF